MNREEAINVIKGARQYLTVGNPIWNVKKVDEAMNMAIEALSADAVHGEWIFNPTDAIDLMFAKPKCSKCGFESSDGGNFCPNCGARMKGGDSE